MPTFLKDAPNFELRAKVCLQLEPHLSAVIFIPGTCGSSDCFESPVGFGIGLLRKWAHICAAVSRPVKLQKLRQTGEVARKKPRLWGWSRVCLPPPLSSCCPPPLQPFKRRGKCQVRTVGHAHEKSLRAARLYLDIHWESKNLGLKRQRGRHFIQSSVKAFVRGENAKG